MELTVDTTAATVSSSTAPRATLMASRLPRRRPISNVAAEYRPRAWSASRTRSATSGCFSGGSKSNEEDKLDDGGEPGVAVVAAEVPVLPRTAIH